MAAEPVRDALSMGICAAAGFLDGRACSQGCGDATEVYNERCIRE